MKLFDQAHYHLRCGITLPMKVAGAVHIQSADGTTEVRTVAEIEAIRSAQEKVSKMSAEEKANLLFQLTQGE